MYEIVSNYCTDIYLGSCPICNKVFRKASYIPLHIRSTHEGQKDHVCPHCQQKFNRNWCLKVNPSSISSKKRKSAVILKKKITSMFFPKSLLYLQAVYANWKIL